MPTSAPVRRVVVVVLDGLRADAIPLLALPTLNRLLQSGAGTIRGHTVAPSVTAAAMTSLLTGVSPAVHGLQHDRFGIPRNAAALIPLPALLAARGIRTRGYMAALPLGFRGLGARITRRLGAEVEFAGRSSMAIVEHARAAMRADPSGLWLFHWPDADQAGHRNGWTSTQYHDAALRLDRSLAALIRVGAIESDPGTVLIVLSDHGGGGVRSHEHDGDHPLDRTIPVILAGGAVRPGRLRDGVSLLDVTATIPRLFGLPPHPSYQGRFLDEAFAAPRIRSAA